MQLYGANRGDVSSDDYCVGKRFGGRQSRKVAKMRTRDKKRFHRRERRTIKLTDLWGY